MAEMSNGGRIVALRTGRDEQAEAVIGRLEDMLELARLKACEGVTILLIGRDGDLTFASSAESRVELVGALEMMKHELMED